MKLLIGADPEVFLKDASGGLVSAIDRIGGSKHEPRPLPIGDGFAVQEDNVALEYNIPAAGTADMLVQNINNVMQFLSGMIQEQGLSFDRRSAAEFPMEQLMDPRAMEFGCEPDFNAWEGGEVNPRPRLLNNPALRSVGGHVHIGAKFKTRADAFKCIQRTDLYLGVPAVFLDDGEDALKRKQLYGKAGACRIKPYGCEYRTLSNFWIFDDNLIRWIFNNSLLAVEHNDLYLLKEKEQITTAINTNNKKIAEALIRKYEIPMPHA